MLLEKTKVLFITPYPIGMAPGQRFRFEQYFGLLEQNGFSISINSFLSDKGYQILYERNIFKKTRIILSGFLNRILLLFSIHKYDFIFLYREMTPIGLPIFEYITTHILKKKIIYDFDDTIWLNDPSEEGTALAWMKCKKKISKICKWSYKVSVGNNYLANFARKHNKNVVVNPTTIDTQKKHNPELYLDNYGESSNKNQHFNSKTKQNKTKGSMDLVIGWTGSHSTLKYLEEITPIIEKLEKEIKFVFLVIANRRPNIKLKSLKFVPWSKETEIEDLMKIDIGIMPLTNDKWSKGKCGFKLLQYMSLNIPVIASSVGVNINIVKNGVNGFLCHSLDEWEKKLALLLREKKLRDELAKKGREKIIKNYSVLSNRDNFLSLFQEEK